MSVEVLDINNLNEERRKALAASIRPISMDELKSLGESLFPVLNHPWRQAYFEFLEQHPTGRYHHGTTHDRVEILYCQDGDKGIWFLPGGGVGPLQEAGIEVMKEIVTKR
jgi:hypothetical protein